MVPCSRERKIKEDSGRIDQPQHDQLFKWGAGRVEMQGYVTWSITRAERSFMIWARSFTDSTTWCVRFKIIFLSWRYRSPGETRKWGQMTRHPSPVRSLAPALLWRPPSSSVSRHVGRWIPAVHGAHVNLYQIATSFRKVGADKILWERVMGHLSLRK